MVAAKTFRPVRPNAGVEAAYRKQLETLVDQMNRSVLWWLQAAYRANEPKMAQDAEDDPRHKNGESAAETAKRTATQEIAKAIRKTGSPARVLKGVLNKLGEKWRQRFDEAAPRLAEYFATKAKDRVDGSLKKILKDAGFSVEFSLTATERDVMAATVNENVTLIKSIASQHMQEVEGLVMRSVTKGRDIGGLRKELEERAGIARRRAALIARDQNNKATAALTRTRQRELGITTAIWKHSHGGKHPRQSHVDFDGKEYNIDKGAYIDGEYIFPGEMINCRCVSRPVIPGLKRK